MKKIIELIEELEPLEQLKIAMTAINLSNENIRYDLETEQDAKEFEELEKISNKIFDIILKNGGYNENGRA